MATLFDVYPLLDIEPVKGEGCKIWDKEGKEYLDFYGGHAVISIGHAHPVYVQRISEQVATLGFYSNSVQNPLQRQLAAKLSELSGLKDYQLFLCNSGAEANENAFKLASFHNGRKTIIAFEKGFHGRTSLAVGATDNARIQAPVNDHHTVILPLNDEEALEKAFQEHEVCAVIVEGIQGIGGIYTPKASFMQKIRSLCDVHQAVFIGDEIQSGVGRSGKFFAFEYAGVTPDLVTIAKGLGNGFPIGGVLISPKFEAWHGMLGTTFGGNHLACQAALAVLEVIETEGLLDRATKVGEYLIEQLQGLPGVKEVRGKGLMIAIELEDEVAPVRKALLKEHHIFTGTAASKTVMRLLPPLTVTEKEADQFLEAVSKVLKTLVPSHQ
ncbi:aspartate aminotransferase family protein [Algivirga pacifica]|uniref:Aminotransferase class III-fold pyridoxal phosphate-dependent enzyme n=1 Tax=Algivirga pacifica TaxID=1162670 RepID=A0ABP9DA32_9BACT